MRIVGSVEIDRPVSELWAYVADYENDVDWRAGVSQMHPSMPGPAQAGITTHEALRLLGMTYYTDATVHRVEAGRLLEWSAQDRQKRLQGSRLVEPTSEGAARFTEVVDIRLLGLLRPLGPLVAWLLRRQTATDLRRLKQILEVPAADGPPPQKRHPELG